MAIQALSKLLGWVTLVWRSRKGGYVLFDDGTGEIWVREGEDWSRWWRKLSGNQRKFEIEDVDNRSFKDRRPRRNTKNKTQVAGDGSERTPLLGQ